jgi:hypothetical protein
MLLKENKMQESKDFFKTPFNISSIMFSSYKKNPLFLNQSSEPSPVKPVKEKKLQEETSCDSFLDTDSLIVKDPRSFVFYPRSITDQAHHCLALITDPLWKKVCTDVFHMMGPSFVIKLWKSKLGSFVHQDKRIDLNCAEEETAQFIEEYSFVLMDSLRQFFPSLKILKVRFCNKLS